MHAYAWYGTTNLGERLLLDTDIILSVDRVRSTQAMNRTATHEWGHAQAVSPIRTSGTRS